VNQFISWIHNPEVVLRLLSFCRRTLLPAFLLFLFTSPCHAIDVTLEWDASADADYYVVEWGTISGVYTENSGNIVDTTYDFSEPDDTYYIAVKAFFVGGEGSEYSREVCVLDPNTIPPPYNRGWEITEGDLKGFKVLYDNNDPAPTPTLGPSSDIAALNLSGVSAVGVRLNLQPSPTVPDFNPPVKIFIPCPGYSDVSGLDIYHYDGSNWALADDTWMVPNSRENHNNGNPSTIAIEVYRFSGVQAGNASTSSSSSGGGGGGGGGGCFIASAADDV
jgi:hypothetical protein